MQAAQRNIRLTSDESSAVADSKARSVASRAARHPASEIGVIGGLREILVPVDEAAIGRDALVSLSETAVSEQELGNGEVSQFWIEVALPNGSVALHSLNGSAVPRLKKDERESSAIFLNCDDIHRTYDELVDRGANFLAAPAKMPFGWLSMFEDNEGRRFVLGQW